MRKALVLLVALLTLPASLPAQSLGEVAAQEKARREKDKAKDATRKGRPAKAFTDDDLQPGAKREPTEAPPPPEPIASSPSSGTEGSEGQGEEASGPRAQWRQRAAEARAAVSNARQNESAAQQEVERIRQDLNPMSLTYNPTDVNATLRLQHELTQALTRLEGVQQQVAAAEKAYKDFEEQARREGVPSSWLE
jgi:hypothetical protein